MDKQKAMHLKFCFLVYDASVLIVIMIIIIVIAKTYQMLITTATVKNS